MKINLNSLNANYVKNHAVMNAVIIAIYVMLRHAKNVIPDVLYVIKIYVWIALKNVEIANSFIARNVPLISKKQNVIYAINAFVIIVYLMCSSVKNAEIICVKIALLIVLNAI